MASTRKNKISVGGGGQSSEQGRGMKAKSRKKRRKEEREAKKKRKLWYNARRSRAEVEDQSPPGPSPAEEAPEAVQGSSSGPSKPSKKRKGEEPKKNVSLKRAREVEKEEISRLEKLLKIDKKKGLPNSFHQDGLDYLLDLTEKGSSEWNLSEEDEEEEGSEEEDLDGDISHGSCDHEKGQSDSSFEGSEKSKFTPLIPPPPPPSSGVLVQERETRKGKRKRRRSQEEEAESSAKKVRFSIGGVEKRQGSECSLEEEEPVKKATPPHPLTWSRTRRTRSSRVREEDFSELDDTFFELESSGSDDDEEWIPEEREGNWTGQGSAKNKKGKWAGQEESEEEEEMEEDIEDEVGTEDEDDERGGGGEGGAGEGGGRVGEGGEDGGRDEGSMEGGSKEEDTEGGGGSGVCDGGVKDGEEELSSDGYLESDESCGPERLGTDKVSSPDRTPGLSAAYVPPHLRNNSKSERLRKMVQGLMNRLSESNMKSISVQMEQLYRENSRNEMNATLWSVLEKACVGRVLISERFSMEQTMLVAILHHRVGTEVGAHVVQSLVMKLAPLLEAPDPPATAVAAGSEAEKEPRGKEADCLLLVLAHLYNYRIIHCLLIYDIIRKLVASFSERDVEFLHLLLKNTGMEIRRDDSKSLKDIILSIQSKAADSDLPKTGRVKFMLETISALRTNNARKIPNYDPSLMDHMKKLLRGLLKNSNSLDEAQLKVSLHDLLNAEKQGRWWVVGSAWSGRDTNTATSDLEKGVASQSWVLELARKQRMNTDVRKTIFGVIMTSEDYVDCFQKLVGLGLKEVQEREMVHVLLDCCLQEKLYNPYYAYLAHKLCHFKKANQVTFQYSLWDRLKSLDSLTSTNLYNLRHLMLHLITKKALSLAIFKIVDFTELSKLGIKFYKQLLTSLLTEPPEGVVREVFTRIAPLPHLRKLRDSLLLFITHYLVSQDDHTHSKTNLRERVGVVQQLLRAEELY